MAKYKWTEYIIEFVKRDGKAYSPRRFVGNRHRFTSLPKNAKRFSLYVVSRKYRWYRKDDVSVRVVFINCELGESGGKSKAKAKAKTKKYECPTCHQDMREPPHDGLNGKDCSQCGQGLAVAAIRKLDEEVQNA